MCPGTSAHVRRCWYVRPRRAVRAVEGPPGGRRCDALPMVRAHTRCPRGLRGCHVLKMKTRTCERLNARDERTDQQLQRGRPRRLSEHASWMLMAPGRPAA
eukprot:366185-Chlamydomonas_euryale.AAC.2